MNITKKISFIFLALLCLTGIISGETFTSSAQAAQADLQNSKGKILLVGSSVNELHFKDGRVHPTGYFLGELATPAQAFIEAGYEIVVATPDGNTPALDKNSLYESLFDNDREKMITAMQFVLTHPSMQKPEKLSEAAGHLDDFVALYVPGGHAPMVDLMQDSDLGLILRHFHANNKPTALLCHGPIAITAGIENAREFRNAVVSGDVQKAENLAADWIYNGYNMTVYSTKEELGVEAWLGGDMEYYVEDTLRLAGGNVIVAEPDVPNVVVDRELVTGQNPFSDHRLADAVLDLLEAK